MVQKPKKLLDQVRDAVRLKHYAYRTEQSYVDRVRRYILFHNKTHPRDMGENEAQEFLTYLASERKVSAPRGGGSGGKCYTHPGILRCSMQAMQRRRSAAATAGVAAAECF